MKWDTVSWRFINGIIVKLLPNCEAFIGLDG